MPRKYKKKGVHTSYDTAGIQNMTKEVTDKMGKDEAGLMPHIMDIMKHGQSSGYKGGWTDEQFVESVNEFFAFCSERNFKPSQPALRVWLHVDKSTIHEWKNNPAKYGVKSDVIKMAFDLMEIYLIGNIDKYPTGNIFLLKTSHGHVETSKVDVTTNGGSVTTSDEVKDAIAKLGLDRPKTE